MKLIEIIGKTIVLYRAMSQQEAEKTLRYKEPIFEKRFKWFSADLNFIKGRVQDGRFNNSAFVTDRYTRLLAFEIAEEDLKYLKVKRKELEIDRRKSGLVKWNKIWEI